MIQRAPQRGHGLRCYHRANYPFLTQPERGAGVTLLQELGWSSWVPSFHWEPTQAKVMPPPCQWGHTGPRRQRNLVPAVLALVFPEHTATPARGAGMLNSHHSSSATRNNSQLLPKGIFSCIIYLNTCLRLQGRERSLSSGGREGGEALGDLDHFSWKIREQ